jgi:hypothetical protein
MKTLFSNKRTMSLIRGGITLLIVSIMVSIFTISPLGTTHAQRQQPSRRTRLGTTKTAFGRFCYSYWTGGDHSDALSCIRQSKKAMTLLQQEISPDSFTKWPQQLSLSDLAAQNLLLNPQTKAPITSKDEFLAAIPPEDTGLRDLFTGDQGTQLLSALWGYKLANNNAPPPPPPPVPVSDLPPSCPVNSQSFLNSQLWSSVGPTLLTDTDNALQNQDGRHLGIYDIYGRLLLQNHCSIAAVAQTMELNGQVSPSTDQISEWERNVLATVALANLSNTTLAATVIVLEAQPDDTLIDCWISAAVITHPTTSLTTSTAPATSGSTPTSGPNPIAVPATSHVQVN